MSKRMKILCDYTLSKGEHSDDEIYQHMRDLNEFMEKPKDENGFEDDHSYNSILTKKIRIVIYIEN